MKFRVRPLVATLVMAAAALGACPTSTQNGPDVQEDYIGSPTCTFDDSEDHTVTTALELGVESAGHWLCPTKDTDWFTFTTGANDSLVTIKLEVDGDLSPVQPIYAVWSIAADGSPDTATASPPPELIGQPLEVTHCMDPGQYLLVVRDHNDDGQDLRRSYKLSVETAPDPDPAEPNDSTDRAIPMSASTPVTGSIACRGDDDYYALDVPSGTLLRVRFDVPQTAYEPSIRITDVEGNVVLNEINLSGTVEETAVDRYAVVPGAGTYYVIVGDDDGLHADPETNYTITIDFLQDDDPNEPNQTPTLATPLSDTAAPCTAIAWGQWYTATGNIGAPGDVDYFVLPTAVCSGTAALLEAELEFDTSGLSAAQQWDVLNNVQASLTHVIQHLETSCEKDVDCQVLNRPCEDNWDCAGLFNNCLPQGLCAGAATCLPDALCGANRMADNAELPADQSGNPPPNRAHFTVPIASGRPQYLRVSDFQGDGAAPGTSYTLRVRFRQENDANEPNNYFSPFLNDAFADSEAHIERAVPVPVWNCDAGECCTDPSRWTEGRIGYTTDVDWFYYQHPCPGMDCMVRVNLEYDAGPVDPVVTIFRSQTDPWFDIGADELANQSAGSLVLGGLQPTDRCFYAFKGHEGTPYNYYLLVADRLQELDWSSDQEYRFCVEKLADGCLEPCELGEGFPDPLDLRCTAP